MRPRCGGLLYGGALSSTASAPAARACAPSAHLARVGAAAADDDREPAAVRLHDARRRGTAPPPSWPPPRPWSRTRPARPCPPRDGTPSSASTRSFTPPASNGVTSATPEPSKRGFAIRGCSGRAGRPRDVRAGESVVSVSRSVVSRKSSRRLVGARVRVERAEHAIAALLAGQVRGGSSSNMYSLPHSRQTCTSTPSAPVSPVRHGRLLLCRCRARARTCDPVRCERKYSAVANTLPAARRRPSGAATP
jgi:hypothetical protein